MVKETNKSVAAKIRCAKVPREKMSKKMSKMSKDRWSRLNKIQRRKIALNLVEARKNKK